MFLRRLPRSLALCLGVGALTAAAGDEAATNRRAPAPADDARGFVVRTWAVDHGLPHATVNSWVQDDAGFLWLATAAGLARFDGLDFRLHELPPARARMTFNVRAVAREPRGGLVMLPGSGGVLRLVDGRFVEHPASSALAGHVALDLHVTPGGDLWLGTENDEVVHWSAGRARVFGRGEGIVRRGARFTFAEDGRGRTWIAGGDFVGWYEGGRIRRLAGVSETGVVIGPARSGGVWIATRERLLKWESGEVTTVADGADWPATASGPSHIFEHEDGTLWIGTNRHGLYRRVHGHTTRVPMPNPQVTRVAADRDGLVWATTSGGGLTRVVPRPFALLNAETGLPESISSSVATDRSGALWCANRGGGLVRYEAGRAEIVPLPPHDGRQPASALAVTPDLAGNIWCGTTNGVYRTAATPPYRLEKVAGPAGAVRVLYCARSGAIWMGAGDGELGFVEDGAYRQVLPDRDSSEHRITSVAEHPEGGIWVATREGALHEWRDGQLHARQPWGPGVAPHRINHLRFDRSGTLWIAGPGGLAALKGDLRRTFTRDDGLPDGFIDHLIEDDDGRLWCAGRIGLFQLPLGALRAYVPGESPALPSTTFGANDGLAGATSFSGVQPMSWRAGDGTLWFATNRGVVGLEPRALARPRPAPPVFIDEVRIDGRAAPAGPLRVPAGNHRLEFRFVALDFAAPEKVRIRHQLVGVDAHWVDHARDRTAAYTGLPAGDYVLRVQASTPDDGGEPSVATRAIAIVPAWWQGEWAVAVGFLAFTAIVVVLARRWSHRRLRQRLRRLEHEHALDVERARIARDLHDELGGGITQIKLLAERLRRHGDLPQSDPTLAKLAWRANRLTADLQSIVWTVSPRNNNWDRLARFIGQFALRFFRDTGVQCHVEGIDRFPARPLTPETQHHLLAVLKEAMNNVLKHAQARQVTVGLRLDGDDFALVIHDDGIGFAPDDPRHGASNGLNNMRTRVQELGGEIKIASAPGHGTTIRVRLRLAPGANVPTLDRPVEAQLTT